MIRKPINHCITETATTIGPDIPLNVYMIHSPAGAVLIDSGINSMFKSLMQTLGEHKLLAVAHTHAHHDHIGSNAQLIRATQCRILAPATYAHWHSDFEAHYNEFARPFPHIFSDTAELREEVFGILDEPHAVTKTVSEGHIIGLENEIRLEAFAFSGHMKEELAWLEHSTRTLILGDVITLMEAPFIHGHIDVPGYRSSLKKLAQLIDEKAVKQCLFAHFAPHTAQETRRLITQAERYIDRVEAAVISSLSKEPASLKNTWQKTCVLLDKVEEFRSLSTVHAHLTDLTRRGIVTQSGQENFRLC